MQHRIFLTLSILCIFSSGILFAKVSDEELFKLDKNFLMHWDQVAAEAHEDPNSHIDNIRNEIDALPLGNRRERVFAEFVLIELKLALENSPEAMADIKRLEQDVRALPEPIYTAKMYSLKSWAFNNMGRYVEALKNVNDALEIAEQINAELEIARAKIHRGQVKVNQERYLDALDDFLHAYHIFKEINHKVELGTAVASIAQIYSQTGQHLEAIDYYKESLKLIDKDKKKLYASIIYYNIGAAYDRVDEFQLSAFFFSDALKLSEELNDKVGQAHAWHQLGNLSYQQTKYREAINFYQKSHEIFVEMKDRKLMVTVGLALAEVTSILGEYESALEYLTDALQIAEEYRIQTGIVGSHKTAAFIFEQSNQPVKALTHFKTYIELKEQSFIKKNEQSLNELKVSFDTEAEKAQNVLLEKQNSLNKMELEKQYAQEKMLWSMIALFTFLVLFIAIVLWRQVQVRKRFAALALTDELTKAPNRRNVVEFARRQLDVALGTNMPVMLAILDLDRFKLVNDNYGHDVGDEILKQFYQLGAQALRNVDRLGRYGGEEWLLVMPGFPPGQAVDVFQRIRSAINSSLIPELPSDYRITFSMGAVLSQPDDTLNSLLKRADDALYQAKEDGRDRWVMAEF